MLRRLRLLLGDPPERIYRDNRINRIFEGTNEINRLIIAGALFKKAGNGTLPLARTTAGVPAPAGFQGPLGAARHGVELAKRLCSYTAAAALEVCGQKLIENQEASARVADMLTEIYAMESAVVRAGMMLEAGHRWAAFAQDCAEAYVNENWPKVLTNARLLLAEVLEGEALAAALEDLRAFDRVRAPVQLQAARADRPGSDREGDVTRSCRTDGSAEKPCALDPATARG